ncbi:MAG TPA: acyl-CoA dehydrogenase family protein [Aliidongia sp.]|uniref:acyl-CoA dehydrogenase family protein n=1 Tax=Aliidongia sp. TaxID=1914230 RepID=UPI002DDDAF21|nr:acyl-CoA dehydrogenase family protein [Aliidongia sp.]HEV2677207.1 acyl-CoA dehydrogenase family protein [Aliidongia sp.]
MDFTLSETQRMLAETTDRLVRERYGFEDRKKIIAGPDGFSRPMWATFAELGLTGLGIAEEHDGLGGSMGDIAVVAEAFGRALVVEPYLPTVVLGAGILGLAGSDAQKAELLPQVVAGGLFLALAHGEPKSRYTLAHVETEAVAEGDDHLLTGAKAVVLGGDVADRFLVSARTSGAASDVDGISLFLVPRDAAGLGIRAYPNIDGTRAADLVLDRVRVPAAARIGEIGQALPTVTHAVDRAIAYLCAEAVGAMQALNALTLDYLKTRTQFGQPIGAFQVLQHRMVDMEVALEQARSLAILACERADDPDVSERTRAVSAAKVQIGRSGRLIGQSSVQMHGGIGITDEYAGGHYFKRITLIDRTFGDADHHLARFAAAS